VLKKKGTTEKELLNFSYKHLGDMGARKIIFLEKLPRQEQRKLIRKELIQTIQDILDGEKH
jgi:hypothetical protein